MQKDMATDLEPESQFDPVDPRDLFLSPMADGNLVQQTTRRLTEAIVAGLLQIGERLPPEPVLAQLLGIAPATLRSAFAEMRRAGYLETRRGRGGGTFIAQMTTPPADTGTVRLADLDEESIQDLVDYRRAVVAYATELAAERATSAEIEALDRLVGAIEACWNLAECVRLDAQLHINAAAATGSKRLWRETAHLEMESNSVMLSVVGGSQDEEMIKLIIADHREIVSAIRARDPQRARAAVTAHIDRGCVALMTMVKSKHAKPASR
ncbi:hypothetical protein AWB99_14290 [Mycolicibacterium confluentis]|uniref:GntR family transcriptional regulator n=2 Tax=Mycolicibacterium confluentis TaxID=28047 RepID=A0A7I7Y203_9MYCO|nr:hypothetical protein AWB99_14290 [Mycolicibacterium confluentis]BBZ35658.1 GntR family transcriptional regulator [Mycolicibacterium confluentis]